jgi:diguanylate cyclase (GGDEF)-like protein
MSGPLDLPPDEKLRLTASDPARDLRYQLWLGSGCFVLMLCGLLIALYALSVDQGLRQSLDHSAAQGSRALHLQLSLVELRRRAEQALLENVRADEDMARAAASVKDQVTRLAISTHPAAGEEARQALNAAVDDSLRLYTRLADNTAVGRLEQSRVADTWRAQNASHAAAADAALRDLLAALHLAIAGETARAADVTSFARQVLVAMALLTALLGLLFGVLAARAAAAHKLLFGRLDAMAHTDGLTTVMNRRGLDEQLPIEVARAERLGYPFTVVMIDLDHFKRYNDRRGHGAGDVLLRGAAQAWRTQLRPTDVLARYGGEEFTLVLPACDAEQAAQLVDRLRPLTPEMQTFSAGIALRQPGETADVVLQRADAALLAAKRGGRNRSVIAGAEPQIALPLRVVN